jgi:hypothetical protein
VPARSFCGYSPASDTRGTRAMTELPKELQEVVDRQKIYDVLTR